MIYGNEMRKRMFVQNDEDQILNCALGLTGEAGEIAEYFKKRLYHPPSDRTPTRADLRKEIGDVLWYLAVLNSIMFGDTLSDVVRENVVKLKERYPERYGDVDAETLVL